MNVCPKCKEIVGFAFKNCDCSRCVRVRNEEKPMFIIDAEADTMTCPECGHVELFDFYATQEIEIHKAIMGCRSLTEATKRHMKLKEDV